MKRVVLSFTFICFMSLIALQVYANDYCSVGIYDFKKGAYHKACSNLEHAIRLNPKNVNARYYLAQTYLIQKRIPDAIEQYNRIILIAPTSDAAKLSQKGLSLIKTCTNTSSIKPSDDLIKYKDNYIDYVLTGEGKILKWESFPVSVYIEPTEQKDFAIKAFEQWQTKSNNLVSFKFIDSPDAQITVKFKTKLESSNTNQENYIAGYSKPYYKGDNIIKSEISILTIDPQIGQSLNDEFITSTTLNEIGHSLGFKGHSPNENDVMYPSSTKVKLNLTKRDLNTLNVFYKTNNTSIAKNTNQSTNKQLKQALDYVKETPDKAVGWANLGDIYRDKKMYSEAIKNYQKAISIEPQKADYYNLLGSTYSQIGDDKNAFINLQKACDLNKTNEYYLNEFVQICKKLNKEDIAKSYIDNYNKQK